jgi:hypothetical protein
VSSPERSISGSAVAPTTTLTWSETLGKRVRKGPWADQAISTVSKIEDAIAAGQAELAAQLIDYFMEEAKVCHVIYQVWVEGFERWLLAEGVAADELADERRRLDELLAFPDGSAFEPYGRWTALGARAGALASEIRGFQIDAAAARAGLDELREAWRQLHDRWADLQSGLLTFVAARFGEHAIGRCYRDVLEPYLRERYAPFDLRLQSYEQTLERNLYISFESMRAHLCGPERLGNLELVEHDDRFEISFDPCGSGGRGQRGDPVEGTPSRSDPPYGFGVTKEAHDWAGNEIGVCYYCAHCVFALELWPAEQWGHPLRKIDPPLHPAETIGENPKPCTWTIYKTVEAIPAENYARIGMRKPGSKPTR